MIRNIGALVSGDIHAPLLDADSIVIRDGRIAAVGRRLDEDADTVIDAKGTTVMPGLVDSHAHPVFGEFTPRQSTPGRLSYFRIGVRRLIFQTQMHY